MAAAHRRQHAFIARSGDCFLRIGWMDFGESRETFGRDSQPDVRSLDGRAVALRLSLRQGCNVVFLRFFPDFSSYTLLFPILGSEHAAQLVVAGSGLAGPRLLQLFRLGAARLPRS